MMKGRPVNSSVRDLPTRLVEGLRHGLRDKSHLALSNAEIAYQAGTSPNMVRYYFGSKDGLITALTDETINQVNGLLKLFEEDIGKGIEPDPIERLVRILVSCYHSNTGAARTWTIEACRPESSAMQNYNSRSGWRIFARIARLTRRLVANGTFRIGLKADLTALTIISLVIGPLVVRPAWQSSDDDRSEVEQEAWTAQVTQILSAYLIRR